MTTTKTKAQKLAQSLFTLGFTCLFVTPLLLLYAYLSQSELEEYRRDGVVVEANVIDKWDKYSPPSGRDYYVKVGFFVGSILEGGELYMPTIDDEYILASTWASLQPGDKIDVVYLPHDPENTTLLQAALDSANLAPIHRYETSLVALVIGIVLTGLSRIVSRSSRA